MTPKRLNKVFFKTALLLEKERLIKIKFPFDREAVDEVKTTFPVRQYHKDGRERYWTIPLTTDNCFKLNKLKYKFTEELKEWVNAEYFKSKKQKKELKIEGLNGTLFKYQEEGVLFAEEKDGRVLIADEMGLGKTIQALAFIQLHKDEGVSIIVCPATVKYNWQEEAEEWLTGFNIRTLSGTKPEKIWKKGNDIIIINFDIVHYWVKELRELNAKTLIIDEIHYIKNSGKKKEGVFIPVKRTKAVKALKNTKYLIGLSGTPIENKPVEIYNIIHMINPYLFPNKWSFQHRYCDPKNNGFGWKFDGATNEKELHKILTENVMIRRLKKNVLPDLPDKLYSFIPLEIDNMIEYKQAEKNFIKYLESKTEKEVYKQLEEYNLKAVTVDERELDELKQDAVERANPLTHLEILKQITAKGKINGIINYVHDFLESGKKIVLFCEHVFIIDILMKEFGKKIIKIDGSVNPKKRPDIVRRFQKDNKIKIFIGNKAAEVGLTLTAASTVGIIEYPAKPGSLKQRIDRLHRITQKFTVNVLYFVGIDTIDKKLAQGLHKKQKMADAILDGEENGIETDMLRQLIDSFKIKTL